MTLQELFYKEDKWTKGAYFRDSSSKNIDLDPINKIGFNGEFSCCLVGGIMYCYPDRAEEISDKIGDYLSIQPGFLVTWNDKQNFYTIQSLIRNLNI